MRDEELKEKVFDLITQLRDAREKSCVLSHELRDTGRALKASGSIMEEQTSSVTVTAKTPLNRWSNCLINSRNIQTMRRK